MQIGLTDEIGNKVVACLIKKLSFTFLLFLVSNAAVAEWTLVAGSFNGNKIKNSSDFL